MQFATKKSQLSAKAEVMLQALANRMERQPGATLDIEGTPTRGIVERQLGLERGTGKRSEGLLDSHGVESNRLSAAGFGESRPKTDNEQKPVGSVNRRTEFSWRD